VAKRYRVTLTAQERATLGGMISRGKADARKLAHARVLLQADASEGGPNWTDTRIAEAVRVSVRTIERVRQRFVEDGLEAALLPRPSPRVYARKLDGAQEAKLVALACSGPPEGKKRWTLRLLAERMVELEVVPELSHETVRQTLKKNALKPHLRRMWCIPPKSSAEFVFHMEDVLEVYHRPYDRQRPVVCLDELQQAADRRGAHPVAAAPGTG
jgi:transposase